jgi:hypothetical protein
VRRLQQAQTAALNDLDGAVDRLRTAQKAMADAVVRAVQAFPSVDDLAEMTPFDARELRAYERRHRRDMRGTSAASQGRTREHIPTLPRAADGPDAATAPVG